MRNSNSKRPEAPVAEVFIWRWAANSVQGDLRSIIAALHAGESHPALATFEPAPVVERLETALAAVRKECPGLLTCMQELKPGYATIAILVSLVGRCDVLKAVKALGAAATELELTGSSAHKAVLLPDALPKHYALQFDTGCVDTPPLYDPEIGDVLESLALVDVRRGICYAILQGANGNYVQVYGCDGKYYVEWRSYHDRTWLNFTHLAAGRRPRSTRQVWLGESKHHVTAFKHELLARTDVERIFTAFYRGDKRPHDYTWRNLADCLESLEPRPATDTKGATDHGR